MMDFDFKAKIEQTEAPKLVNYSTSSQPKTVKYIIGFIVAAIILFTTTMIITGDSSESWLGRIPLFGRLFGFSEDKKVMGEEGDRINVLLLGMGGKNHDGGYLADTIMMASLKPSTKKAEMFSFPRDLTMPTGNGIWQKINSINAYAENKGEDGALATSQTFSEILETPIHYYIRVDFDGFINIIDELGGVEVEVENAFDDYAYPIRGEEDNPNYYARYEHLHFDKGLQTMDGATALKYARSRHALGPEGSDFARARRQQKIISAAKDKLLQKDNLLKPGMLARIVGQLEEHIKTNITIWEGIRLWTLFKDITKDNIVSHVFDDSPTGMLAASVGYEGAYILMPKTGNFGEIKSFIQNIFSDTSVGNIKIEDNVKIEEKVVVEIKNGTNIGGLASQMSEILKQANFQISRFGNASKRDFTQAMIYDLTYGEKNKSLDILKAKTGANISTDIPDWLVEEIKQDIKNNPNQVRPDFILILGANNR